MRYVEQFQIQEGNTKFNLAISKEDGSSIFADGKAGFHPWFGGCGIGGTHKTIAGARLVCFNFVKEDVKHRIAETEQRLVELRKIELSLGNDVFNLGQYKMKA